MAKNTKEAESRKRRTQVRELPKPEKELSKGEQKTVKGGLGAPGNFGDTPGLNTIAVIPSAKDNSDPRV